MVGWEGEAGRGLGVEGGGVRVPILTCIPIEHLNASCCPKLTPPCPYIPDNYVLSLSHWRACGALLFYQTDFYEAFECELFCSSCF